MSETSKSDEFFIGYLPKTPPNIARLLRSTVVSIVLGVLGVGSVVALNFRTLPAVAFDWGDIRPYTGTLVATPYPALWVDRPGAAGGSALQASRYHLVGEGKFGVGEDVAALDGRRVSLNGTLVYRDGQTMIEVQANSIAGEEGVPFIPPKLPNLGLQTLRGEIVDSKCFLGVMNPGNLKVHRACAIRCISGGIPPILCVRDESGRAAYLLLVGEAGQPVGDQVLGWVARPVQITGVVQPLGDQLVLVADPETYTTPTGIDQNEQD